MNDFNDNFEATIGSQIQQNPVQVEQKNIDANKAGKDNTEMKIDENNSKQVTEKEREEMFLAKKRNREEEEKKAD